MSLDEDGWAGRGKEGTQDGEEKEERGRRAVVTEKGVLRCRCSEPLDLEILMLRMEGFRD